MWSDVSYIVKFQLQITENAHLRVFVFCFVLFCFFQNITSSAFHTSKMNIAQIAELEGKRQRGKTMILTFFSEYNKGSHLGWHLRCVLNYFIIVITEDSPKGFFPKKFWKKINQIMPIFWQSYEMHTWLTFSGENIWSWQWLK